MNVANRKRDRRALVMILLFIGAILWIWFAFSTPEGSANIFVVAENTKTALALTADSLLGPFPTQTAPTKTASASPTPTPLISATPTFTPSVTITPSPTNTLPTTATQRTRDPALTTNTATATPPVLRPTATRTRIVPTNTFVPPTNTSNPPTNTSVPPTDPPPPTIVIPTIDLPPLIETLLPFP